MNIEDLGMPRIIVLVEIKLVIVDVKGHDITQPTKSSKVSSRHYAKVLVFYLFRRSLNVSGPPSNLKCRSHDLPVICYIPDAEWKYNSGLYLMKSKYSEAIQ